MLKCLIRHGQKFSCEVLLAECAALSDPRIRHARSVWVCNVVVLNHHELRYQQNVRSSSMYADCLAHVLRVLFARFFQDFEGLWAVPCPIDVVNLVGFAVVVSQLCGSIFDCILPHFQRPLTGVLSEHWSRAGTVRHRFNRCSAALELVVVVVVVSPRSAGDHVDASSKSSGEAKSISHAASLAEPAAAPAVVHVQSRRLALVARRPESRSESGSESGSESESESAGRSPGQSPGSDPHSDLDPESDPNARRFVCTSRASC